MRIPENTSNKAVIATAKKALKDRLILLEVMGFTSLDPEVREAENLLAQLSVYSYTSNLSLSKHTNSKAKKEDTGMILTPTQWYKRFFK